VSVTPLGFVPIASVTFPVKLVTVFEDGIRAGQVTGVLTSALASVLVGCWRNPRWVAGGGGGASMLNALLVALVSCPELAVSVYRSEERRVGKECRSRWSMLNLRKDATRSTGATGPLTIREPHTGFS